MPPKSNLSENGSKANFQRENGYSLTEITSPATLSTISLPEKEFGNSRTVTQSREDTTRNSSRMTARYIEVDPG